VRQRRSISLMVIFLWILSAAPLAAEMVVQACFSPAGKCSSLIIREIQQAKKELLVAVYAFTSDELATAVVQAKKRGLAVQVVIDRDFDAGNERSKGKFLEAQRVPVRRIAAIKSNPPVKEAGLMHQKFAVLDRSAVLTGSYNWTHAADRVNDENLLFFRDAGPLAEEYRRTFLQLWERKN
jgi:phosphatidylserine/phosphatidylglycerophosphate/cardiolipin synthase-like enzyme